MTSPKPASNPVYEPAPDASDVVTGTKKLLRARWRVGRKVGRTIYAMVGPQPSDDDVLIGVMDSEALARDAVGAHNTRLTQESK